MDGSATLTMVKSSTTMNCAIASDSSNGSPAPGASCPADGSAGLAGVITLRSED
jgi:hypothetical protein